jgi:hypothetical protein
MLRIALDRLWPRLARIASLWLRSLAQTAPGSHKPFTGSEHGRGCSHYGEWLRCRIWRYNELS